MKVRDPFNKLAVNFFLLALRDQEEPIHPTLEDFLEDTDAQERKDLFAYLRTILESHYDEQRKELWMKTDSDFYFRKPHKRGTS
jgi:hypothetical protein